MTEIGRKGRPAAVIHPKSQGKTMRPYLYSETSTGQTRAHTHTHTHTHTLSESLIKRQILIAGQMRDGRLLREGYRAQIDRDDDCVWLCQCVEVMWWDFCSVVTQVDTNVWREWWSISRFLFWSSVRCLPVNLPPLRSEKKKRANKWNASKYECN